MTEPISPITAAFIVETVEHAAVTETHPESKPAPAETKSYLFVSSFFDQYPNIGLKMTVPMHAAAPATIVETITSEGLLLSLSYEIEKELPPLNMSQLQKSMRQPAVTNVRLVG